MIALLLTFPFLLQAVCIGIDEFYFHHKRGLPRWERIGHPLDTLSLIICLVFVLFVPFSTTALWWYIGLALFSCGMVTKDEFVHKEHCPGAEQWLHALLFINHSLLLTATCLIWSVVNSPCPPAWLSDALPSSSNLLLFLRLQCGMAILFCGYQIIYWNIMWKRKVQ